MEINKPRKFSRDTLIGQQQQQLTKGGGSIDCLRAICHASDYITLDIVAGHNQERKPLRLTTTMIVPQQFTLINILWLATKYKLPE